MAKPEAQFISNLHKRLADDEDIYKQSMFTPYSGGTPDNYYETAGMSLWIEYKFEHTMPKIYRLTKKLSPLQTQWCDRAYENRQNVAVVVGFGRKDVVVFIDGSWVNDYTKEELEPHIITRDEYMQNLKDFMYGNALHLAGID